MRHTNAKITLSTYAGLLGDDKVARLGERLAGLGIMKSTKVTLGDGGSIALVVAATPAGQEWLDQHIEPDALRWCNGVAVEHRYLDDMVHGMINDGLEVS
jgi:hypothetical protein